MLESDGLSKLGAVEKINAPVVEPIVNCEASAPPVIDQETDRSALKVCTAVEFSGVDTLAVLPVEPPGPVMVITPRTVILAEGVRFPASSFPAPAAKLTEMLCKAVGVTVIRYWLVGLLFES